MFTVGSSEGNPKHKLLSTVEKNNHPFSSTTVMFSNLVTVPSNVLLGCTTIKSDVNVG